MDFGFGGKADDNADKGGAANTNADGSQTTDFGDGKTVNTVNGEPADDINGNTDTGNTNNDDGAGGTKNDANSDNKDQGNKEGEKPKDDKSDGTSSDLVEGSIIELGEDKYTVDAKGNLLDKDGGIFKESKDVKDWLATFDNVNDEDDKVLSIATIQKTIGVDVVDEEGKPVEFENTPDGIKAYVEAVTEASREEHYEEAINTLYQKYPIINDVLNYYVANGNSLEGFGEVQDRSGITIEDSNEAQHESIIRTAWIEQNRKGDVEGYIQYLKSSGTLLATAKEELSGLQELDKQAKDELAERAAEQEKARIEKLQKYWDSVGEVIKNKNIAGYQIPDTIIINRDGKKISATPNDFYNYVYQVDKDGKSGYERDLAKEDPNNRRDDELLRAYLKFVGGNYSNLVGMAVNKDKVKTLRLQAATRTANSVKITKPSTNTKKGSDVDLGFN